MSYSVFIQKFENGDSANIEFKEIEEILLKYGKIESGNFGLEFISTVGEMFEYASFSGTIEEGISGISFDRPTLSNKFPLLIFDLLNIKNTCFFGTDLDFINSRYEMKKHYPKSLIENLTEQPKIIEKPLENWKLT